MLIYLIGYMGSGKSTLARALAEKMSMDCLDTDHLVEDAEGMVISEIFKVKGETYFRLAESKILNQIFIQAKNTIIATGGGLPCHSDNIAKMKESGKTIYVRLSSDALYNRLNGEKSSRPLIAGIDDVEDLKSFISNQLEKRDAFYQQADYVIDGDQDIESLLQSIRSLL